MSLLLDSLRRKPQDGELTKEEIFSHHRYQGELLADGFVSPIVLPCDRLKELQGTNTISEMADKCHIPTREMQVLLENDFLEPTPRQLLAVSIAYQVSILWLLGYHTAKDIHSTASDRDILTAVGQRNSAEQNEKRIKDKGFIGDLLREMVKRRIHKANLMVSNTAARIIATEHIPLSERELYMLRGQPVFVEHTDGKMEWGLVMTDTIQTLTETIDIEACGASYQAFQTPDIAVKEF